jgi:prevent-host-death family protein
MKMQTVSYVKAHLAKVIETVREGAEPVLVTQNGTGAVVIQSHESYERVQKALMLLKLISLGESELAAGKGLSTEEVFSAVRARREQRKRRR